MKRSPIPPIGIAIGLTLLLILLYSLSALGQPIHQPSQPPIVLDGQRDASYVLLAQDPSGDLAAVIGQTPVTQWTDLTDLYTAFDGTYFYVYIDLPNYTQAGSSGEIGLALKTSSAANYGGTTDPWGRAITYAYDSYNHNVGTTPMNFSATTLPNYVIRGNIPGTNNPPNDNNGWTELRAWNGTQWTGSNINWGGISNGGQTGSRIAYANNQGVEFKILYSEIGLTGPSGGYVHLQAYTTQKAPTKGAYDTIPSDDQSIGWDDPTTETNLSTLYVSDQSTPTVTGTPGPSPTPTITPTPGGSPCGVTSTGDNAIGTDFIYHNSLDPLYRDPLGSIPMTGTAKLTLRTCANDVQEVLAWVWKTGAGTNPSFIYTAVLSNTANGYNYWQVDVPGPNVLVDQWYQFKVTDGTRTGYYRVADTSNSGPGAWSDTWIDRSWKLGTLPVPPPDYDVPSWMQDAVIYQIFPDRFRNGDPSNDPPAYTAGVAIYGPTTCNGYPHGHGSGPLCIVDKRPSWNDPLLIPSWGLDFYGGDLQGVLDKINEGYFNDLGVNVLYFNPIFEASSNHGYDTNDYYAIRAYFGDNAKFEELITAANAHGLRIILDGVYNHAGSDSRYNDGYGLNRWPDTGACEGASPYRSWFKPGSSGSGCTDGWSWSGWYGYETIPEFLEVDAVKAFFYRGGSPQSPAGTSVTEYWLNKGIAGWRFDVAQDISHTWWQDMRPYVKEGYGSSETLLLGEVTGGCDWGLYQSYVNAGELDSAMNYCFRDWGISFANGTAPSNFDGALNSFRGLFSHSAFYSMMNLISSHDSPRALRLLNDDKSKLKLLVLLQMTLPGAPSVYYGDEVGMTGGGDPDNRRTYPWADTGGSPDMLLYEHYKTVIGIRQAHSALRNGELATLLVDDANQLYSYIRWNNQERVVIVLNNSADNVNTAVVPVADYFSDGVVLVDVLNGNLPYTVVNGTITLGVNARWGHILVGPGPETAPDLSPSSKEAPTAVAPEGPITYTLTIANSGTATATATVTDTLPTEVSIVLASLPNGATYANGTVGWQGDVAPGQSVVLSFQTTVNAGVSGVIISNSAQIGDGVGTQITRSATTAVANLPLPDLSASSKSVTPTAALAGDILTYTITLANSGLGDASASFTDTLPAEVTLISATLPAGVVVNGDELTWSGVVTAGEQVSATFAVMVNANVTNTLVVNAVEIADGVGGLLTRWADTAVGAPPELPDLSLSSKTAVPATAMPGESITYTLTLINSGNTTASLRLTDTLPVEVTPITATLPAGMTYTGGQLHWSGDLPAGETQSISYAVTVNSDAPEGPITNSVTLNDGAGTLTIRTATVAITAPPTPTYWLFLPVAIQQ